MHSHDGDPASINAWVRVYEEDAIAAAVLADERLSAAGVRRDGPAPVLTGIPLGLKDLFGVAGKPLTASSRLLADVPTEDCDVWRQLAAAGMVLLGHLHTHEFAAGGTTDQVGEPVGPRAIRRWLERRLSGRARGLHGSRRHRHRHRGVACGSRRRAAAPRRSSRRVAGSRCGESCRWPGASTTPARWRARSATADCCWPRWPAPIGGAPRALSTLRT